MPLAPPRPNNAPLNALRALEAAGRHGSFLRAAEELSVTPGAVAQQIKKLEEWADVKLFDRHRHGVALTPLGQRLMPQLEQGFEALGHVSQTLRHAAERPEIRIAALPAIAQLWLSPRLTQLRALAGDVNLAVHALDTPPMLGRGDFDMAIYPALMNPDAKAISTRLSDNFLMPVAAPCVAATIQSPKDLRSAVLIHDLAWRQDWSVWLDAQGLQGIETGRGPTHSLYSIAVDRCIAGDGVLMGHSALIRDALDRGALETLFPDRAVAWHPICLHSSLREVDDGQIATLVTALTRIETDAARNEIRSD
jgi:LysR family glycine cleavage system transcriptional activator